MLPYYELVAPGANFPVDLPTMKAALKLETEADDDFVQLLIEASTLAVEAKLHGRQVRANQYRLLLDCFADRICISKDPVASVDSVERLVLGVWTAVSSSTYYLRPSTQGSEVLLAADQDWPSDQDEVEQAVRVVFTTAPHPRFAQLIKASIIRHVTFMHENRGDCDPESARDSLKASGAESLLGIASLKLV